MPYKKHDYDSTRVKCARKKHRRKFNVLVKWATYAKRKPDDCVLVTFFYVHVLTIWFSFRVARSFNQQIEFSLVFLARAFYALLHYQAFLLPHWWKAKPETFVHLIFWHSRVFQTFVYETRLICLKPTCLLETHFCNKRNQGASCRGTDKSHQGPLSILWQSRTWCKLLGRSCPVFWSLKLFLKIIYCYNLIMIIEKHFSRHYSNFHS